MTGRESIIVIIKIFLDHSWPCIFRFCSGTYIPTGSFEGNPAACHLQKSISIRHRLAENILSPTLGPKISSNPNANSSLTSAFPGTGKRILGVIFKRTIQE
jgi:hypothetical protein